MSVTSRRRAVLAWSPEWSPKIENWTAFQISKNIWRFDQADDFDDLMQQSRILFWQIHERYPNVREPANFFALYKTSLLRRFIDKARARRNSPIDQNVDALATAENLELQGNLPNCGLLSKLLEEMPDELKKVLKALTTGRVRRRLDRPTTAKRHRENYNMRLKRQLGLTSNDPVGDLRNYILNT
jgi:DNA-directed RNA polymerase specialized sigma24 family protein